MRLRLWLAALDLAHRLRAPRWLYLWLVGRASAATDWGFEAAVAGVIDKHKGNRSVSGIKRADAPEPLPNRAPSRYVHRTQYVRDLREPG